MEPPPREGVGAGPPHPSPDIAPTHTPPAAYATPTGVFHAPAAAVSAAAVAAALTAADAVAAASAAAVTNTNTATTTTAAAPIVTAAVTAAAITTAAATAANTAAATAAATSAAAAAAAATTAAVSAVTPATDASAAVRTAFDATAALAAAPTPAPLASLSPKGWMKRDAEILVRLVKGNWLSPGLAQWMAVYLRLQENEVRGVAPSVADLTALDAARRGVIALPPVDMGTPRGRVITSLLKRPASPEEEGQKKKPRAINMGEEESRSSTQEPSSSGSMADLTMTEASRRPLQRAATMASERGSEAAAAAAAAAAADAMMKPPPAGRSAIPRWQSRDPRRAQAGADSNRAPAHASAQAPAQAPMQAAAHAAARPPAQADVRPPNQAPAQPTARPPSRAPAQPAARPPNQAPAQPAARPPNQAAAQLAARPPNQAPAQAAARPPAQTPAQAAARPPAQALAQAPAQAPALAPAHAPAQRAPPSLAAPAVSFARVAANTGAPLPQRKGAQRGAVPRAPPTTSTPAASSSTTAVASSGTAALAATATAAAADAAASAAPPTAQAPREPRYPRICVDHLPNWVVHFREISRLLGRSPAAVARGRGVHFTPKDGNEYRTVQRYINTLDVQWHSYSLPSDRPLKVAIRGLPPDTEEAALKEDLEEKGFTVEAIKAIRGRGDRPGCVFFALLARTQNCQEVFTVKELLHWPTLKVEAWRGKQGPAQCHRCQLFRHSSVNCHRATVCVRCGGPHKATDCERPLDQPATCANCGGPHPANHSSCPVLRREARNRRAGPVARSGTAPTPQNTTSEAAEASLMAPANPPTARGAELPKKKRKKKKKKNAAAVSSAPVAEEEAAATVPPPPAPQTVPAPASAAPIPPEHFYALVQSVQQMQALLAALVPAAPLRGVPTPNL
ncbi:ice-structuring glycoprotein-like [Amyelois transitella]|uniref:ice-structuring glycoprotein-like n=1 Tax=Amyelois transitella TaxID=680683 RepID=UPI002990178C|nr:ice-structuring glycoprotein-like [Amyelois transitella]